jgi:hypothetical protein
MNRKENMLRLKQQGYSYQAIGALYGMSRQRIHQIISGYDRNNNGNRVYGWYKKIHNSITSRDDNKCQKCEADTNLVVHHIDGNDKNNSFLNLITLCNNCHLDLHRPAGWVTSRSNPTNRSPTNTKRGKMPNRPKTERNQKILVLWNDGKGWRQKSIARMYKMSESAVQMVIARAKVTPAKAVSEIQEGAV